MKYLGNLHILVLISISSIPLVLQICITTENLVTNVSLQAGRYSQICFSFVTDKIRLKCCNHLRYFAQVWLFALYSSVSLHVRQVELCPNQIQLLYRSSCYHSRPMYFLHMPLHLARHSYVFVNTVSSKFSERFHGETVTFPIFISDYFKQS